MPYFVRIQLSEVNRDKYSALHNGMEHAGFRREITGVDGNRYWLPHGEYYFEGTGTEHDVHLKAATAVVDAGVEDTPQMLITVADNFWYAGLMRVQLKLTKESLASALSKITSRK